MKIKAIEIVHGTRKVENTLLFKESIPEIEKLAQTTRINQRFLAEKHHQIEDYFIQGIQKLSIDLKEIDVIITVTQTPSKLIPSLSNYILSKLDFSEIVQTFDLISGCSGYTEALDLANTLLKSGLQNCIICNGDFSSHVIDSENLTLQPIFSDVAAITWVQKSEKIEFFCERQNLPSAYEAINSENGKMTMNGLAVYEHSVTHVAKNIKSLLAKADVSSEETNFYLHQANFILNDTIRRQLKLEIEQFPSSLELMGNSSSASIPLTLALNPSNKKWNLLAGFGVGFKICSVLIENTTFDSNISAFENSSF